MKLQIFLNFIRAHRCPRLDWFSFKTESPTPLKSPQTWSSWANWPLSSPVFPLIPFSSGLEFNLEHHMGPVSLVSSNGQQCLRLSLSLMTGTLLRRAVRYGQSESPSVCVCPNFSHDQTRFTVLWGEMYRSEVGQGFDLVYSLLHSQCLRAWPIIGSKNLFIKRISE